jgi:hypothetical protein
MQRPIDPKQFSLPLSPSNLETIDYAVYDWLNDRIDVRVTTHAGYNKVPVIWAAAERTFQIKNNKDIRDDGSRLILPLISIERTATSPASNFRGKYQASIPSKFNYYNDGGVISIDTLIQQAKTTDFANADSFRKAQDFNSKNKNKKIVYEIISAPIPVHVKSSYTITLRTNFQEQMNSMITQFIAVNGQSRVFSIKRDGHGYELLYPTDSITTLSNNIRNMQNNEREYKTEVKFDVLGYIFGDNVQSDTPKIIIRESIVEFKLPRESVIVGTLK